MVSERFEYYLQAFGMQKPIWNGLQDNGKKFMVSDADGIVRVLNKEHPKGNYYTKKVIV